MKGLWWLKAVKGGTILSTFGSICKPFCGNEKPAGPARCRSCENSKKPIWLYFYQIIPIYDMGLKEHNLHVRTILKWHWHLFETSQLFSTKDRKYPNLSVYVALRSFFIVDVHIWSSIVHTKQLFHLVPHFLLVFFCIQLYTLPLLGIMLVHKKCEVVAN